jgi:putative transposase
VKKQRHSVEQITQILKQAESGAPVGDLCRQVGIAEQTFYRWKKVYGGMLPSEARELKAAPRRECATEEGRGGSDLGQGHAPRRRQKKW